MCFYFGKNALSILAFSLCGWQKFASQQSELAFFGGVASAAPSFYLEGQIMKNTKRVVLLFGFVLALVALLVACGTSTEEMPEPEATEDLTPKHTVKISVDFISNLIFSKYDVEVDIDGTRVGVLDHGEDGEYNLTVKEGIHTLTFSNNVSSSVNGSVKLAVASDVVASYRISCYKDRVDVETLQVDYLNNSAVISQRLMALMWTSTERQKKRSLLFFKVWDLAIFKRNQSLTWKNGIKKKGPLKT